MQAFMRAAIGDACWRSGLALYCLEFDLYIEMILGKLVLRY